MLFASPQQKLYINANTIRYLLATGYTSVSAAVFFFALPDYCSTQVTMEV